MNKNEVENIIKGRELDPKPCGQCGVRPNMRHGSANWIQHAVVIVCVNPNCSEYGFQTVGDPMFIDNTIELWNDEQDEWVERNEKESENLSREQIDRGIRKTQVEMSYKAKADTRYYD
jgi:hypothetical protein